MNGLQAAPSLTVETFSRFISFVDAKPKTIETYTRALRQLFRYFAQRDIVRPRREDLLAFRETMKRTCKPATVQSYITAARLFFQWTEQEGAYPNIAAHLKGAAVSKEHKKDYLTSAQARAVLESVPQESLRGLRDYAILTLMITGGLRTIEVSRANVEDLRVLGNHTVLFIQGKGREDKSEYVKIAPQVELAIRTYLKAAAAKNPKQPLFCSASNNSKGQRLTTRSISGIVKARLMNAGYDSDRLSAHSLRHTAVTLSLLGGNTLQEVQQFARHSNITTTQIYAHNLDRAQNKCEETIAQSIF